MKKIKPASGAPLKVPPAGSEKNEMPSFKSSIPEKEKSLVEIIAVHFEGAERNGRDYKALCPAHDDSNPSLSIGEGEDGRVLVHCHAGCPTEQVLDRVGLQFADLMSSLNSSRKIAKEYDYRDEDGELLFQEVRYEPKGFSVRRPDDYGGWIGNVRGIRRVLYRYPEFVKSDPKKPVYIVEGPKDVDRLIELGFVATCNPFGAGKWLPEYNSCFEGRKVVILSDNDDPGRDHAENVAENLVEVAEAVRIVEFTELPEHGDVSDFLDAGGSELNLYLLEKLPASYVSTLRFRCREVNPNVETKVYGSKKRLNPSSIDSRERNVESVEDILRDDSGGNDEP